MPAVSKRQQRFMGIVHAVQKGKMDAPSDDVVRAAKSMDSNDVKHFAKTKHKNLPEKKSAAYELGFGLGMTKSAGWLDGLVKGVWQATKRKAGRYLLKTLPRQAKRFFTQKIPRWASTLKPSGPTARSVAGGVGRIKPTSVPTGAFNKVKHYVNLGRQGLRSAGGANPGRRGVSGNYNKVRKFFTGRGARSAGPRFGNAAQYLGRKGSLLERAAFNVPYAARRFGRNHPFLTLFGTKNIPFLNQVPVVGQIPGLVDIPGIRYGTIPYQALQYPGWTTAFGAAGLTDEEAQSSPIGRAISGGIVGNMLNRPESQNEAIKRMIAENPVQPVARHQQSGGQFDWLTNILSSLTPSTNYLRQFISGPAPAWGRMYKNENLGGDISSYLGNLVRDTPYAQGQSKPSFRDVWGRATARTNPNDVKEEVKSIIDSLRTANSNVSPVHQSPVAARSLKEVMPSAFV